MTVHDEVCGMDFPPEEAVSSMRFQGKDYYFCSERCRERFEDHPGWYVPLKTDGDAPSEVG